MNEVGIGSFFGCNELSVAVGKGVHSHFIYLHWLKTSSGYKPSSQCVLFNDCVVLAKGFTEKPKSYFQNVLWMKNITTSDAAHHQYQPQASIKQNNI